MDGYWEVVRACNKECRWMRQHDASLEVSLVMGELEVNTGAGSFVQIFDQRLQTTDHDGSEVENAAGLSRCKSVQTSWCRVGMDSK